MFKLEFKELPAITLVMGVLIVVMALLGTNPISNQPLDLWVRIALGVVSILLISIALLLTKKTKDYNFPLPTYQVKHNKSINLFNIIEKTFLEFGEKNKDSVIFASKGNRIISQGDIGKHVFFIKDGSVLIIFREYPSSEEKEVDTRHKGSIIGEAALYNDNSIRTASVEVISSSSELVKMTRDELLQAASKNNELKDAIASLASLRHARSIQTSLLCGHDVTVKNEICSILVADIHHFSHLGENVWSELSNSFLYRFIWECERITSKYSCVFEDQGDGFKIIFRGIDHSHRAIKCAKEICKSFSELRTEYINEENSFRLIGLGIGIVSDFLSIIFRTGEKEYIVGNSINIASAISKYRADPDEIGVYLHPGVFLYSNKNELTIEGPSKKWLDKIAKSVDLFRLKLV